MRSGLAIRTAAVLMLLAAAGCAHAPWFRADTPCPGGMMTNPTFVAASDPEGVWETLVDVVDDYFAIEREEPVRLAGSILTEGRLETRAEPSATLLEPWRHDVASGYDRLESTLQTYQRRAVARVIPAQGGYWIEVAVLKELADAPQHRGFPLASQAYQSQINAERWVEPVGPHAAAAGWVPEGRDEALEQRILGHLCARFGGAGSAR